MPNYRNNQYNPYTAQYTNPVEGINIAYQPVYDPSETERWANLLQERSQRYDIGRQNVTDFESQLGGIQTYEPDLISERVGKFHSDIKDMVNTQYGGDYGLAAGDIAQKIATEKGNKLYKLMDFQNKQAEDYLQAKRKLGNNLIIKNDPTRQGLLKSALSSEDPYAILQADYMERPDRVNLTRDLIKDISPDVFESFFNTLSNDEKIALQKAKVTNVDQLFKSNTTKQLLVDKNGEEFKGKLGKLRENIADLLMEQDRTFAYEFDDPNTARNEALNIVDKVSKLYEINQNQGSLTDFRQTKETGGDEFSGGPALTIPRENTASTKETDYVKNTFGEGKIDLDKPIEEVLKEDQGEIIPGMPTTYSPGKRSKYTESDIKKYRDGITKINEFDELYDFPENVKTNQQKIEFISGLEDSYYTHSKEGVSFDNFKNANDLISDATEKLASGRIAGLKSFQGYDANGNEIWDIASNTSSIDIDNRQRNISLNKSDGSSNFSLHSINPENGAIIAKYNGSGPGKGSKIEYYPNSQAQLRGEQLSRYSNMLKTNNFAADVFNKVPILTIKAYNTKAGYVGGENGGYQDLAIQIPNEFMDRYIDSDGNLLVQDYKSAKKLFDDIYNAGYPSTDNQSLMVDYVLNNAIPFGYVDKKAK